MRRAVSIATVGGVWISVAVSVIGFVLPWATLDVKAAHLPGQLSQALPGADLQALAGKLTSKVGRSTSLLRHSLGSMEGAASVGRVTIQVKRGAETITGELPDLSTIPTRVNGPQIPEWINRRDAKVVMALAEMLTGQRDLGAKSYAVYLVPGLALLGGVLVTLAGRLRVVCGGIGGACLAIAGLGFWKLLTIETGTRLAAITIGPGLWLSLWAYVGLGICAILLALD